MNTKQLAVLAFLITSKVQAAELIPFSRYAEERPNWFKEGTELAYTENRCGALYSSIGIYFEENGTTQEDKEISLRMNKRGFALIKRGGVLATKYGMTLESSTRRTEAVFKAYVDKLIENKRLNNSIFSDDIIADLKFCEDLVKVTKVIDSAMTEKK